MQTLLEMYTLGLYRNFSGVNARLNTITMVGYFEDNKDNQFKCIMANI